ncbi:MAG: tRNA (cytidine(34)-2 -O)-methyltransferase-like [Trebouxia sp. A1-2]|nr:MAG: tRNA (cytidine(34)-2 -O)-methyltransferase-like [Trebouxia sp. A1-2]
MHLCFRTLPGVKLCTQTCQSIKTSGRRACSGSPFKRSLLAFAEREAQEQPWSANSAGQKQGQQRQDLHLVLVNPQIPQNAGSVARTCAATSVALHLVKPLGFDIDSRKLKRAGLDYWPFVVVKIHDSWQDFYSYFNEQSDPKRLLGFSKRGTKHYATPGTYQAGDWLMFGAETTGLPTEAHTAAVDTQGAVVKIPMIETHVRSLNLAVSVGVGLYEAIRQLDFAQVAAEHK